jgi:putative tryptophan/tyrosine transport system substrate-binding protein
MRRREFIAGLGSAAAWPLVARAQQRALPIIGWLHALSPQATGDFMPAFFRGLAEMGFVEGRNVAVEVRWAEGHTDRRAALAADLVRRQVAVIVTDTTIFARVAKEATQTIPVVFLAGGDPVEFGLVASLNRPGGNLTGVTVMGPDLTAKRLELLHKLVPAAASIAVLVGPAGNQYTEAETRDLQSAARVLGVRVQVYNIVTENEIAAAFTTLLQQQAGAVLMSSALVFFDARDEIISLAARYAIPTMFFDDLSAAAGALSSYGPDYVGANYQAGLYAGRILKGEKPADLPVLQPTKFQFVINLKTAKALGLTIPETLLAIADEVIQ